MNIIEKTKEIFGKIWDYVKQKWEHRKLHLKLTFRELKWTKFDTYLMKNFLPALFGSMFLFIAIYELTQVFNELKWLPPDVDSVLLLKRYLLDMTYWIVILQPFSFLFATVFVLSKMINTKELMAVISTGTSIYRVTFYLVLFSVVYYIVTVFVVENALIFPAYQKSMIYKEVIYKRADMTQLDRLKDNRNFSMFGSNDLLYIVGYYNAVTKELENITIVQFAENNDAVYAAVSGVTTNDPYRWLATNIQNIDSERLLAGRYAINFKLRIDAEKARWDSTTTNWIFMNGTIRYMISSNYSIPEENFTSRSFTFVEDPPRYFEKVWYNVDAMTLYEGIDYIKRLKKAHQEWKGEQARLLSKLSYPVGVIFVVLIGIGLANVGSRKSSFIINFITSLGLFLVYYLFFSTGLALCSKGELEPFMGAFMGTIVFTILSIVLYARTKT